LNTSGKCMSEALAVCLNRCATV